MKKARIVLMCLPLLISSCTTERQHRIAPGSGAVRSSKTSQKTSSSSKASYDFGDDPTSIYDREEKTLVKNTTSFHSKSDVQHLYKIYYDGYGEYGPEFELCDDETWVNIDVIGDDDIGATVRSFPNGYRLKGYDGTGDYLDGPHIKGIGGGWFFAVLYANEICRHPCEAFFKITFFAKDNLEAITGYALAVAYPYGDPVEAMDPNADIIYPVLEERYPGPVWLDWKAEVVCEGVHFPKVEGLYQRVDPDRVEAALDIMIENAKGHYFQKDN